MIRRQRSFILKTICLLTSVFCFGATARVVTFPQLALGGGYQCVFIVSNKTSSAWQGTATLRQGNERAWSTVWTLNGADRSGSAAFDISLDPSATAKFVLTGDTEGRAGYLVVAGRSGFSTADVALAFFYNFVDAGRLVDSTGTQAAQAATDFALCRVFLSAIQS